MSSNRDRGDAVVDTATQAVQKKSAIRSTNLWTGIATVLTGAFAYFSINADLGAAQSLSDEAHKAVEAIETKNYLVLVGIVVNVGNILYHLLFKK